MTEREKLVEIISTVNDKSGRTFGERFNKSWIEMIANHLIANGVTVRKTVTGKCGSCVHAQPNDRYFRGSKGYIICGNPEKRFKRPLAHVKQRSCPACKLYAAKEE